MEVNKDKLIEVLTKIDLRLTKIEELLSTNKITQNSNNSTKDSYDKDNYTNLPFKSTIDFELLIDTIDDSNLKNKITQIFNNQYPTLTKGQYKFVKDVAEKYHVAIQ